MKKILACVLTLALSGGVLVGCADKTQTGEQEFTELNVFSWQLSGLSSNPDTPITRRIKEKLGIVIKPVAADANTWEEKLNALLASGSTPDIFLNYGPVDRNVQFNRWIKDGIVLNLDEYVKDGKYPNLEKAISRFEWMKDMEMGNNYCIPVATYFDDKDAVVNSAYLIREDWLENLGMSAPESTDELYKVLKAFKENDPDKNGENDTYGLTSNSGIHRFNLIYNAFGASLNRFAKEDGKWKPEVISDDMKEAVRFLRKLYVEQILDPDFVVNTEQQVTEKFVSGKVGLIYSSAGINWYNGYYSKFEKTYPGSDPSELIDYMPVMNGTDGKRADGVSNFWLVSSLNAQMDKSKIEKSLELIDYLMSDEGLELVRWGVEGEEFKKENGVNVSIVPNDANGAAQTLRKYDVAADLRGLFTGDAGFENRAENAKNPEAFDGIAQYMESAVGDPLRGIVISEDDFKQSKINELSTFAVEKITKMILESDDIDKDFDAFVKQWNEMGGTEYVEKMNLAAEAAGK